MKRQRRRIPAGVQTNLFHPCNPLPAWKSIPEDARQKVTELVARMIHNYRVRQMENDQLGEEVGDE